MRTLKYAILGLLNNHPCSGYDLAKEFQLALNEFWSANHSQIYPELKRLTEEGLVTYQIEISGEVLEKKVYTITPEGKADFLFWLEKDVKLGSTPKDVFRLKLFFSSSLPVKTRIRLLESQKSQHQARLSFLQKEMSRFPKLPPADRPDFGDYLVLKGAVMREQSLLDWLEYCLTCCRSFPIT